MHVCIVIPYIITTPSIYEIVWEPSKDIYWTTLGHFINYIWHSFFPWKPHALYACTNRKFLMHNVYRLFLNITIQHIRIWFNNRLSLSFTEFEHDIDDIFDDVNAHIPQFTTRSDTPSTHEKSWISTAAFTFFSGLVSAYRFYKDYVFKKNMKQTLHYILDNQNHFSQNILTNKCNLLSFAEITSGNFKDVRADISDSKSDTDNKFDTYLTQLMHSSANSIFYKNYVLCYVNILYHLNHDLLHTTIGLRE